MWMGVDIGLAGMKLSGSESVYGLLKFHDIKINRVTRNPKISLMEKNG